MTLLKCKNGHKWDYNGQNQKGEKATCPKCRVLVNIPSLIIAAMLVFGGIGVIYAEEVTVNIPFDSWNTEFCTFLGFPLENGTTVYEFECVWTAWEHQILPEWQIILPEDIIELPLPMAPDAFVVIPPEDREAQPTPETEEERIERLKDSIDERRAELDVETEAAIGKLAECRTGLGAFAAYQEQEAIQDYANKTRWQFAIRDNLSNNQQIGTILKAIEECRIMKRYADMNLIGAFELNKILADMAGLDYLGRTAEHPLAKKTTDFSEQMVETDPVTERDRADELEDMERLRDELIEQRIFEDPDAEFTGENRGFQPVGTLCQTHGQPAPVGAYAEDVCPMSRYDAHILEYFVEMTYQDILRLQCDNFLYIYQHKIGTDDFPVWLNHCVPKVVREG